MAGVRGHARVGPGAGGGYPAGAHAGLLDAREVIFDPSDLGLEAGFAVARRALRGEDSVADRDEAGVFCLPERELLGCELRGEGGRALGGRRGKSKIRVGLAKDVETVP